MNLQKDKTDWGVLKENHDQGLGNHKISAKILLFSLLYLTSLKEISMTTFPTGPDTLDTLIHWF